MRPRWVPLVVDGKLNEAVRRSTATASGAYAVRRRDSGSVVYVGESSRGTLWKTLLRHFQPPGATRASFVASDPSAYDVAIWKTSTGKRRRATKRSADQRAMAAQARWIETLKPFHNTDDGKAKAEETAAYRAAQAQYEAEDAERGAFDGLINPSPVVKFGAFPRLSSGNDDAGKPVLVDGVERARVVRVVEWKDVGGARATYRPEVRGYVVELGKGTEAETAAFCARYGVAFEGDKVFPTLAEAQEAVRAVFSSKANMGKPDVFEATAAKRADRPIGHNEAATFDEAATLAERAEKRETRPETENPKGYVPPFVTHYSPQPWPKRVACGHRSGRMAVPTIEEFDAIGEADQCEKCRVIVDRFKAQRARKGNPARPDIFAATAAARADRERRLSAWVAARGTRPYEAEGWEGVRVLVSPDPSKPGRWRVTRFLAGEPIGHNEAESFHVAATIGERDFGAPIPEVEPAGALARSRDSSRNPASKRDAFTVAREAEKARRAEAFRRLWLEPAYVELVAAQDAALRYETRVEADRHATIGEKAAALDARRAASAAVFAYEDPRLRILEREIEGEQNRAAAAKHERAEARKLAKEKRAAKANPQHESAPRTLTALGLLTRLSYEGARGTAIELRWTLKDAPTLAVDERGRLRVVYLGRVVRPSSKVERAAYRKLHWGQEGRGEVAGGGVAVPPMRTLGKGVSVTYTTRKGIDRKLVDYVHAWGEGGSGKFVPPLVVEHHCRAKGCTCEGAIALAGGTYVVEERGIVG